MRVHGSSGGSISHVSKHDKTSAPTSPPASKQTQTGSKTQLDTDSIKLSPSDGKSTKTGKANSLLGKVDDQLANLSDDERDELFDKAEEAGGNIGANIVGFTKDLFSSEAAQAPVQDAQPEISTMMQAIARGNTE